MNIWLDQLMALEERLFRKLNSFGRFKHGVIELEQEDVLSYSSHLSVSIICLMSLCKYTAAGYIES